MKEETFPEPIPNQMADRLTETFKWQKKQKIVIGFRPFLAERFIIILVL